MSRFLFANGAYRRSLVVFEGLEAGFIGKLHVGGSLVFRFLWFLHDHVLYLLFDRSLAVPGC